jgi:hypothetical protein
VLGIPYLFLSKREALFRPRGINMEFQRDKRRYLIFQDEFGLIVEILFIIIVRSLCWIWIVYYSPKKICSRKAIDTNEGNKLHDS